MKIRFEDAGVTFGSRVALHPVTTVLSERRIGIIGLNGSGKTTFARLINGLVTASQGRVLVEERDVAHEPEAVRADVGYIFQNPQHQIILPVVGDDIALGLKSRKLTKQASDARVAAVLERLGIADLSVQRAHELSGGELQLAALAAVLVMEPKLLILDEPTNQLDLRNRNRVQQTIAALPEQVIAISHDLPLLADFDRVLMFHEGRLIADGLPDAIIDQYRMLAA